MEHGVAGNWLTGWETMEGDQAGQRLVRTATLGRGLGIKMRVRGARLLRVALEARTRDTCSVRTTGPPST
eukprot:gene12-3037_t